jgi:predicted MFS family arabinose efflux permease
MVAQIFGIQHLSMLSGFIFFSHQIGSFMGVWLGGFLYDRTGSYDIVWYVAIALGVFALYTRPDFLLTLANQMWNCF